MADDGQSIAHQLPRGDLDIEVKDELHKADAISKIKAMDGVYYINDFRGKEILVGHVYENDESLGRNVPLIESICEAPKLALWDNPFPRADVQLSHLDWRIIEAMWEDAGRDLEDVAKSLGVSARTVQRRLTAMKEWESGLSFATTKCECSRRIDV